MKKLFKLISTKEITLLKHIDPLITINKFGKFRHFCTPKMELINITNFISKLDDKTFYTVIPIITMSGKTDDPYIILSKQILITKKSSPQVIHEYLKSKLEQTIIGFGSVSLDSGNNFQLSFKYKKVTLDFSRLPKESKLHD